MQQPDRQALAAEVLEMGEQLFALALEGQTSQQGEGETEQIFPKEEIEAASVEFFSALRLLLSQ